MEQFAIERIACQTTSKITPNYSEHWYGHSSKEGTFEPQSTFQNILWITVGTESHYLCSSLHEHRTVVGF